MKKRGAPATIGWVVLSAMVLAALTGCSGQSPAETTRSSPGASIAVPGPATGMDQNAISKGAALGAAGSAPSDAGGSSEALASPSANPLVISTAGITIEVKNLDPAVASVRAIATRYGGSIAELSTNAGGEPIPTPQPLSGAQGQSPAPTPGGAVITLRIPADKLAAAERDAAGLGRVISETSSQIDVTQQHVDLSARLKNLQAEEARLRSFFNRAKNVSEMLSIEQELSRVRGEIESMQAQLTYLEQQAALATLTISLSEPGAIVSPAAGGWGFSAAIRDGVRAAAVLVRGLITVAIAFSPIIVIGLVLWFAIRAWLRRRRRRREAGVAAQPEPPLADQPPLTE